MRRLSSAVYAMQADNANKLGTVAAANYLQYATGTLQSDSSTNNSVYFNHNNATGDLIHIQSQGTDAFTVTNTGSVLFGNNADKTISVVQAAASGAGSAITVTAGQGGATGAGGAGGALDPPGRQWRGDWRRRWQCGDRCRSQDWR